MSLRTWTRPSLQLSGLPSAADQAVLAAIGSDPLPRHGPSAQTEIARRLARAGFRVFVERRVFGLGRDAFLDVYAVRNGLTAAIEIDRGRPKASSYEKLGAFRAQVRLAVYLLDKPLLREPPAGVLAALLPSREPNTAESAFKGFGRVARELTSWSTLGPQPVPHSSQTGAPALACAA